MRLAALCIALAACQQQRADAPVVVFAVSPPSWPLDQPPSRITISGRGFHARLRTDVKDHGVRWNDDFSGTLGGEALPEVRWDSNERLYAVPPELPIGVHTLTLEAPNGGTAILTNAVAVVAPVEIESSLVAQHAEATVIPAWAGCTTSDACIADQACETAFAVTPPVDASRTILFYNYSTASNDTEEGTATARLADDGTAVIFSRVAEGAELPVSWTLLELEGVSVQRDLQVLGAPLTYSISLTQAVAESRSFVLASVRGCDCDIDSEEWVQPTLVCNSDTCTGLELNLGAASWDGAAVEWQVVELPVGASVWHGVTSMHRDSNSAEDTLPGPVSTDESFLVFTQIVLSENNHEAMANHEIDGYLVDGSDRVRFERGDFGLPSTESVQIDISWSVVTWSGLQPQQLEATFATGETAQTVPLTRPVDPARSASFLPGYLRQGRGDYPVPIGPASCHTVDYPGLAWFTTELTTDGTEVVVERAFSDGPAVGHVVVLEAH